MRLVSSDDTNYRISELLYIFIESVGVPPGERMFQNRSESLLTMEHRQRQN